MVMMRMPYVAPEIVSLNIKDKVIFSIMHLTDDRELCTRLSSPSYDLNSIRTETVAKNCTRYEGSIFQLFSYMTSK